MHPLGNINCNIHKKGDGFNLDFLSFQEDFLFFLLNFLCEIVINLYNLSLCRKKQIGLKNKSKLLALILKLLPTLL